jgi:sulfonate dioxygenase
MAPSATETTTLPTRTVEPTVKLTSNTGPYKELAPIGYSKKAEEEGSDGFKAAKVRRLPMAQLNVPNLLLLPQL